MTLISLIERHRPDLLIYEEIYKKLHANPELGCQEKVTSETIANHLRSLNGYEVKTSIGGHGVVGILRNGPGKTVLIRADMDALPLAETTLLPYASDKRMVDVYDDVEKPVMHACGHDMHCAALLAASEFFQSSQHIWKGTVVVLFQPDEEHVQGAKEMVLDGLYDTKRHGVPIPDIVLGAHIMPQQAGVVETCPGPFNSAVDSLDVTVYGRGGHGSRPHETVDPVVVVSSIVMKLQTIVSREVDPRDTAVVTVGAIQAGSKENIISDHGTLKINIRTFSQSVRDHILSAIERVITSECLSFRCSRPPTIKTTLSCPMLYNDEVATQTISQKMALYFGPNFRRSPFPSLGSEDFGYLADAANAPSCFWNFGGIDPQIWSEAEKKGCTHQIPGTHSPGFRPAIHPTMETAVDAYAVATLAFLGT